jgi:hypothetical protein
MIIVGYGESGIKGGRIVRIKRIGVDGCYMRY